MASFPNIVLTKQGLDMIAQAHDASPLIFTRLKLGNGSLVEGEDIKEFLDVKSEKISVPLQSIKLIGQGQVKLRFSLAEVTISEGFFVREVGVYAKLGENGAEKLYAYTNAGNLTDYLDVSDLPINELFDIDIVVGNATVLNVIVKDEISATIKDLEEHNEDPNAHEGVLGKTGVPLGSILAFPVANVPEGYLECNGAAVGRDTYAELFAIIGTTYGIGDGNATFNLPDLRGEFIRGWSNGRSGVDEGRVLGSEQGDAIRNITGDAGIQAYPGTGQVGALIHRAYGPTLSNAVAAATSVSIRLDASQVVPTADENRPRNLAMVYCIKAFHGAVNQGLVDITELANDVARIDTKKVNYTDYTSGEGWRRSPDGFIEQWGVIPSYADEISFPIEFPNECLNVNINWHNVFADKTYSGWLGYTATSKTGFTVAVAVPERSYRAIGR